MTARSSPPVLMAHCFYRERGGEDLSFEAETRLLTDRGQPVIRYTRQNREIDAYGLAAMARLAWRTVWAADSHRDIAELIARERPLVAHFQNTFPLISPSAYSACRSRGVPVVQSLRNYRLLCPKSTFLREGRICEDCLGKTIPWPGVIHACYRGSRSQTAVVAWMLASHKAIRTWHRRVDLFIVPSRFARDKLISGGLPPRQIVVKPNFIEDPGPTAPPPDNGSILFIGRLSEEKGVEDLIRASALLKRSDRLRIIGEGPQRASLESFLSMQGLPTTILQGARTPDRLTVEIQRSAIVVVPSRCYETFGRVVVEAYACGRPVIAPRLGAFPELLRHEETGFLFEPGDITGLAAVLDRALSDPAGLRTMGERARAEYERRYSLRENFDRLMGIYRLALERRGNGIPEALKPFQSAPPESAVGTRVG